MNIDYFFCELCGVQLLHADDGNKNKFPVTRRFETNGEIEKLLTVRCAECVQIPYWLKEGNPSRSYRFIADGITILMELSREYNYWSHGIGHLLELYVSDPDEEDLDYFRSAPLEIGFLVQEDVNLIVLAHRFLPDDWMITPYQWHFYQASARAVPLINPLEENNRKFTLAVVNDVGGKYLFIREGFLSFEFASAFHGAIHQQIERGIPVDIEKYRYQVNNLFELLINNKVDSMLQARTSITHNKSVAT